MWNKMKAFFTGRSVPAEEGTENRQVDYTVRKNRKFDMLARVLAVLAALTLWIYVVSTTTVSEEQDFSLIPVVCNGEESLRSDHGLVVQSISIDTLNVRLMGNRQELRAVTAEQVKAYVSLAGIDTAGEYELKVYVDVPSGITVVSQTVGEVVVEVDQVSHKQISVTADQNSLQGWTLSDDSKFGDITLNVDSVTLEGPTRLLEKVKSVELRSDVIGLADRSFTVTATPYPLDAEGHVITDSTLTVREAGKIKLHVEVLKSKTVPIVLKGKQGYLTADQYTVSPSTVVISGKAEAVDAIDELIVAVIDESTLDVSESRVLALNITGLNVTDTEGLPISSVQAKFDLSALPSRTVSGVTVRRGEELVGTVSVVLRGVSADSESLLQAITAADVQVFANADQSAGDLTAMTAVLGEFYRNSVYVLSFKDYLGTTEAVG